MNKHYLIALGIFLAVGLALFGLLLFFIAPTGGYALPAATTDLDAETMQVAKGLYCPVCPGVPLDVCDTQACEQWRALIRQKLGEGQTSAQIESYFVEQYGERVLGAPRATGFNALMYAIPAFAVAAGAAGLYLFAQRRTDFSATAPSNTTTDANAMTTASYRARIERELRENE